MSHDVTLSDPEIARIESFPLAKSLSDLRDAEVKITVT
jgi:hypothetical protein